MKLDAQDIRDLKPVIRHVVAEVLNELRSDEASVNGCLAMPEAESAAAIGVERHVLRDARLRGEIQASRVGKKIIYSRNDLLRFLEQNRT